VVSWSWGGEGRRPGREGPVGDKWCDMCGMYVCGMCIYVCMGVCARHWWCVCICMYVHVVCVYIYLEVWCVYVCFREY